MTPVYNVGMDHQGKGLTIEQIKLIVKEAISEGLDEKLTALGIDTSDPIRTQQMFQTLREIVNFRYGIKAKLWGTVIALSVVATASWLFSGIMEAIRTAVNKGG